MAGAARRALDWRAYAAAFLLFRIFDIAKPVAARLVERRVAAASASCSTISWRRSTLSHCC